jgi:hypothetical protein
MRRFLAAAAFIAAFGFPAFADSFDQRYAQINAAPAPEPAVSAPSGPMIYIAPGSNISVPPPSGVVQPAATMPTPTTVPVLAPPAAPPTILTATSTSSAPTPLVPGPAPATQNTITTTAPVSSNTTISVGSLAGQVLMWIMAAFSVPIGGLIAANLVKMLKYLGVQVTQQMSDQLDRTITNGLNDAAAKAAAITKDTGVVTSNNQIVAAAVQYAQDHRSETIQALGLDPKSGAAVEAIKARIATLVADPAVPTPAVLDPPAAPKAVGA